MSDYPVKQIKPNHADHISGHNPKFLTKLFDDQHCIAQPKYDGERMLIHIVDGKVYCTSRRISKKTDRFMENQDRLPILQYVYDNQPALHGLGYTVIDCECYAKDWSEVVGVLHSLPERAIELQKNVTVKFAVFDCLWYNGQDLTEYQYIDRLNHANKVVKLFNYEPLHLVKFITAENDELDISSSYQWFYITCEEDWKEAMDFALSKGFEGIVVKSLEFKCYDKAASLKCKKFETVDVVVYDYVQGRGKYTDTIGALKVGYFDSDTNEIVHISNVNCSTDAERNAWRDNWNDWKLSVIEVLCQEVTDKSLRHPRYVRRREDKNYTMCTKETIFK